MRGKRIALAAFMAISLVLIARPAWAPVVPADTFPPYVNVGSDNPSALTSWQQGTTTARMACTDPGGSGCDTSTYGMLFTTTSPGSSCPTTYSSYNPSSSVSVPDHGWACAIANDTGPPGNQNESYPTEFFLDNSGPVTSMTVYPPTIGMVAYLGITGRNGWYTGLPSTIGYLRADLICTDNGIGCNNTKYCVYTHIQGVTSQCTPNLLCDPKVTLQCSQQFTTDGEHRIVAFSNDSLGNTESPSKAFSVKLDSVAPAISIDPRTSSFATITGNSTDATSGVNGTDYRVCLTSDTTCSSPVVQWTSVNLLTAAPGNWDPNSNFYVRYWTTGTISGLNPAATYTVYFRGNDTAGNLATVQTTQLVPDNQPPTITASFTGASGNTNTNCGAGTSGKLWWRTSPIVATLSCQDVSTPCTMLWCNDTANACLPSVGPIPTGAAIPAIGGEGTHYIRVNGTDSVGNTMSMSNLHQECFGIDSVIPSADLKVTATDISQKKFVIAPSYSSKNLDSVNISVNSSDATSGIDRTEIKYVRAGEAITYNEQTFSCTGGQTQCDFLHQFQGTGLMYRILVFDNAGNMKAMPSSTGWYFLMEHPVANFEAHESYVIMGTMDKGKVQVRNVQNAMENVTIMLDGYALAWFEEGEGAYQMSADRRELNVTDLAQGDSRTFHIGVMASDPGTYALYMNATAIVSGVQDGDTLRVVSSFPADFPGLEMWAIILLFGITGLVYWRKLVLEE